MKLYLYNAIVYLIALYVSLLSLNHSGLLFYILILRGVEWVYGLFLFPLV